MVFLEFSPLEVERFPIRMRQQQRRGKRKRELSPFFASAPYDKHTHTHTHTRASPSSPPTDRCCSPLPRSFLGEALSPHVRGEGREAAEKRNVLFPSSSPVLRWEMWALTPKAAEEGGVTSYSLLSSAPPWRPKKLVKVAARGRGKSERRGGRTDGKRRRRSGV